MRILIAEDDQVLADGLCRSMRQSGYAIDHVASGRDADSALSLHEYDLLILDLGLPHLPGIDVLKRLRSRNSPLPVLILTAADSVEQRVRALDLGADDFMAKPFALTELEARVRALVRRSMGATTAFLRHGPLSFDQVGRSARINEQPPDLSARETDCWKSSCSAPAAWSARSRSSATSANGARRSATTRSRSTCIACAGSWRGAGCASSPSGASDTAWSDPPSPAR
jgi:DNA-binding response OmpR family regulator